MRPETEMNMLKGRTAMLASLLQAVAKAGGYVPSFSAEKLDRMSAMQLIKALGPNHIRFFVDAPKLEKSTLRRVHEEISEENGDF